jgi:hypothetical protein
MANEIADYYLNDTKNLLDALNEATKGQAK